MRIDTFNVPLFVPGNRPERFLKAATSGADAVILDLEDAVPDHAKEEARFALHTGFTDIPILVRINGEDTPWYKDDIATVSRLPVDAIIVPKAEIGGGLAKFAAHSQIPVIALVETALGLSQARQIAALPGIARLFFGSIDFSADIGCAHTREALQAARSELVLASRIARIPAPVDGVTTSIDDSDLLTSEARYARDHGFGGKLAIHPRQITPIKIGLQPDDTEIEWAQKVLAAGDGAVLVDGQMVDEPVRIKARSILARRMTDQT